MEVNEVKLAINFPTYDSLSEECKSFINYYMSHASSMFGVEENIFESMSLNVLEATSMQNIEGSNDYILTVDNLPSNVDYLIIEGTLYNNFTDTENYTDFYKYELPATLYKVVDNKITITANRPDYYYNLDNIYKSDSTFFKYKLLDSDVTSTKTSFEFTTSCKNLDINIPFYNYEDTLENRTISCCNPTEKLFQLISTDSNISSVTIKQDDTNSNMLNLKAFSKSNTDTPIAEMNFRNDVSMRDLSIYPSYSTIISGGTTIENFPIKFNYLYEDLTPIALGMESTEPYILKETTLNSLHERDKDYCKKANSNESSIMSSVKLELPVYKDIYSYDDFLNIPVQMQLQNFEDGSNLKGNPFLLYVALNVSNGIYGKYTIDHANTEDKYKNIKYQARTTSFTVVDSNSNEESCFYKVGFLHKDGTKASTEELINDFCATADIEARNYTKSGNTSYRILTLQAENYSEDGYYEYNVSPHMKWLPSTEEKFLISSLQNLMPVSEKENTDIIFKYDVYITISGLYPIYKLHYDDSNKGVSEFVGIMYMTLFKDDGTEGSSLNKYYIKKTSDDFVQIRFTTESMDGGYLPSLGTMS